MSLNVTVSKVTTHPTYKHRVGVPKDGKPKYKYFKTKKAAQKFAKAESKRLEKLGTEHADFTDAERHAVIAFRLAVDKLPDHAQTVTLRDAVNSFVSSLQARHKSISCDEVASSLIDKLKSEGCGKRHLDSMEQEMKRFNSEYGDRLACDISTDIINDFLMNLSTVPRRKLRRGEKFTPSPLSGGSKIHYRRTLNQMFKHAVDKNASPINPVIQAIRPKASKAETGILTPKQAALLLAHADASVLPAITLSLFAGIRRAEVEKLDWAEINLHECQIEIKASIAKKGRRRLIPVSKNLKIWLRTHDKKEGLVVESEGIYRGGLEKAITAAKISPWPRNAARHSFGSYHLAMHENAGKTAMAMGHPDPRLTHDHYISVVSKKTAEEYWSITPLRAKKEAIGLVQKSKSKT